MGAKLTSSALDAALGSRAPRSYTREGRVRLIGQAARAMIEGRPLTREQALFLGGALLSWLEQGGDLTRQYLRVAADSGSHRTPTHIWRIQGSSQGAPAAEEGEKLESPSTFEGDSQ